MLSVADLRRAVKNALAFASSQPDVAEVEVFASAGANLTVRLNYTSHIPSNGVEEPKSTEGYGLGVRATFRTPDGIKTEESDRSVTRNWLETHLTIGINAMTEIGKSGEKIRHYQY